MVDTDTSMQSEQKTEK